jgi:Bacteriophage tail sheath protein
MSELITPGVYFRREPVAEGFIPAATATAGFVGYVPEYRPGSDEAADPREPPHRPVLITTWTEFCERFGDIDLNPYAPGCYLAHAVRGFFENGGTRAFVVRVPLPEMLKPGRTDEGRLFAEAEVGELVGTPRPDVPEEQRLGMSALMRHSGRFDLETRYGPPRAQPSLAAQAPEERRPVSALDPHSGRADREMLDVRRLYERYLSPDDGRRGLGSLVEVEEVSLIAIPDLMAGLWERDLLRPTAKMRCPYCSGALNGPVTRCPRCKRRGREIVREAERDARLTAIHWAQQTMVEYCESSERRIALLDPVPGLGASGVGTWVRDAGYPCRLGHAAFYYPWIQTREAVSGEDRMVPPCGHIAGVWARNDTVRGVHIAPANIEVADVLDVECEVTGGEQDTLYPYGINCIRAFPGRGIQVWGARTLTQDHPDLKYLNVRRLLTYIVKSVEYNMQWAVFEPNNTMLWDRITRMIVAFLTDLWRRGRLAGATPELGFQVQCDEETNPPESVQLGRIVTEIRVAPLKPAEYIVLRVHQEHGTAGPG